MLATSRACPPAIKNVRLREYQPCLDPVNDGVLKMPPESGPAVADLVEDWRLPGVSRLTSSGVSSRPGGAKLQARVHSAQDGLLPVNLE